MCVCVQALSKITSTGAMTFCFIQAIERSPQGTTYGNILNSMRTTIRNTGSGGGVSVGGGGGGVVSSVLTMLLTGGSGMGGLRQVQKSLFHLLCSVLMIRIGSNNACCESVF